LGVGQLVISAALHAMALVTSPEPLSAAECGHRQPPYPPTMQGRVAAAWPDHIHARRHGRRVLQSVQYFSPACTASVRPRMGRWALSSSTRHRKPISDWYSLSGTTSSSNHRSQAPVPQARQSTSPCDYSTTRHTVGNSPRSTGRHTTLSP